MDKKIFFVVQNMTGKERTKVNKKKAIKDSMSNPSSTGSDEKLHYSLREIIEISDKSLEGKIFSLDSSFFDNKDENMKG